MTARILVAGVGNIFLGDDGFGPEVAARLLAEPEALDGVRVVDFGIRGVHLAYELLSGYDVLIIVDAAARGGEPGTVHVIEPDVSGVVARPVDGHDMTPEAVLAVLGGLGGEVGRVRVVGCEPADVTEGIGLSEPVSAAVDQAVLTVRKLIQQLTEQENGNAQTPAHHSASSRDPHHGGPLDT